eukprot:TRINITY_DN16215_c0_g1_i4.p2 TRINITY_DN16215_c0_g1~~TRINITY_DN16215_c0_g1_i4.p2  ORF type:complete len:114 (+),score=30.44 TRINITY_DN16215_c0_g1_i4:51-392(+)
MVCQICFFFFSSRRRHTRCREVSWARRCVQETGIEQRRTTTEKQLVRNFRSFHVNSVRLLQFIKYIFLIRIFQYVVVAFSCYPCTCLLYTSDAADDTPCVDLGGRRIIKKKKK